MLRLKPSIVTIVGLIAPMSVAFAQEPSQTPALNAKAAVSAVAASDLVTRIPVIGSLGIPLWQKATIRGKWVDPGPLVKDSAFTFYVSSVNGKKLEKPVEFRRVRPVWEHGKAGVRDGVDWTWIASVSGSVAAPKPSAGQELELVVIETGQLVGWPDDVFNEVGPVQMRERGFVTELEYLRQREVKR